MSSKAFWGTAAAIATLFAVERKAVRRRLTGRRWNRVSRR